MTPLGVTRRIRFAAAQLGSKAGKARVLALLLRADDLPGGMLWGSHALAVGGSHDECDGAMRVDPCCTLMWADIELTYREFDP
jgi:hypothetical protein